MAKINKKEKTAHLTVDNFCCACDYDIAVFEQKLKAQRDEIIKDMDKLSIKDFNKKWDCNIK